MIQLHLVAAHGLFLSRSRAILLQRSMVFTCVATQYAGIAPRRLSSYRFTTTATRFSSGTVALMKLMQCDGSGYDLHGGSHGEGPNLYFSQSDNLTLARCKEWLILLGCLS
jgi:hypothetical protein